MGTSKQEQLDLFEGRIASDEDDSETDQDSQGGTQQQLLASTPASAFSSQPSRSFSTWQGPESAESAPDHASRPCSCQSSGPVAVSELGSEQHPGSDDKDSVDPKEDSSSSGEDTSSSDSDSSSNSDEDPDGVQPIEMAKATQALQ